ncbi:hypothetical protein EcWSU1_02232 [Enterobacter ludwigii]|uniref:Uncharacterized protein n=1 Tax=Enterobacter ludwigii TaxID=299767 RepID=G8LQ19_9ENTR|nr:hypothetical protein EcWSU1_02232 [Enterobacter ludwigii]
MKLFRNDNEITHLTKLHNASPDFLITNLLSK